MRDAIFRIFMAATIFSGITLHYGNLGFFDLIYYYYSPDLNFPLLTQVY